ncbi:hypothetical protein FSZ17_22635 [Cytobacillus dafuensis]|uniref:ATPase BadF/BadG/BcrA/BcrD type domain-containing protein n=1 Tax=Cytobacillus dafuensis TaxID=1742359 RepID=A0A5B8ZC72_CYTDA|nr:hypothetical protein FSZ17_22635 [Cytobacillus dafuensis]
MVPLNNDLFIGFDGGGTKTIAILGDCYGNIISSATGASTNLKSRPQEKVKAVIHELLEQLLQLENTRIHQIKGVFVSTAGGDREEDRKRWEQWTLEYGLQPNRIIVENDAAGALTAGTKTKDGIVLIAGTGSIAYFVKDGMGKPVRSGGWGYLYGDEGSGYDIGNQALRMIVRSHDGRDDKKEAFTSYILEQVGLESPEQLITFIYEDPYPRKLIASIAEHVISLAKHGESNAKAIIQHAIDSLVELVVSIIRRERDGNAYPLVISGGLFHSAYFKEVFERSIRIKGCHIPIISPKYPPVVGSYIRALLQNGEIITDEVGHNIDNSWERALKNV